MTIGDCKQKSFDAEYGCFFLDEVVKTGLLLGESSGPGTLHHLKEWSREFADHAQDPDDNSSWTPLTQEMEIMLEQNWTTIMGYEELPAALSNSMTSLKVY